MKKELKRAMFAVRIGKCSGRCPEIWEVDEHHEEHVEIFSTREEAEEFIRKRWGKFPVEC
jgi:hypothetical protein